MKALALSKTRICTMTKSSWNHKIFLLSSMLERTIYLNYNIENKPFSSNLMISIYLNEYNQTLLQIDSDWTLIVTSQNYLEFHPHTRFLNKHNVLIYKTNFLWKPYFVCSSSEYLSTIYYLNLNKYVNFPKNHQFYFLKLKAWM